MAAPSLTYTLTNGTTADASQVMQDLNDLLNGYTDGTRDLTCNNITTNGSNVLGLNSSDNLTVNATLISNIVPTDATYTLGDSTHNFKQLFMDNGVTDGGSINFNAGTTSNFKSSADGLTATISGFTSVVGAASGPKNIVHAWVTFDGTGAISIVDSFNVTSLTDNGGSGDYNVNLTTAFSSVNIAWVASSNGNECNVTSTSSTSSSLRILTRNASGTLTDASVIKMIAVGAR